MPDDDFASRLEGLEAPGYVMVTVDEEDESVTVASNLDTTADVRRALAMAAFHFADEPEWTDLDPPED